jgi:hypothetical protein
MIAAEMGGRFSPLEARADCLRGNHAALKCRRRNVICERCEHP